MKKIIIALTLLAISYNGFSQTCEERENKLLSVMGSLSAGFLYNTYGLIGSIADGFGHDAYNASTTTDLMNAQSKLADNMIALLQKMIDEKAFKEQADIDYINSCVAIVKGLKIQVQLFLDVVKNNSQRNLDAYNAQRDKNWKDLSKLMGIKG